MVCGGCPQRSLITGFTYSGCVKIYSIYPFLLNMNAHFNHDCFQTRIFRAVFRLEPGHSGDRFPSRVKRQFRLLKKSFSQFRIYVRHTLLLCYSRTLIQKGNDLTFIIVFHFVAANILIKGTWPFLWLFVTDYPDIKIIIKIIIKRAAWLSICEHLKISSPFGNPLYFTPNGRVHKLHLFLVVGGAQVAFTPIWSSDGIRPTTLKYMNDRDLIAALNRISWCFPARGESGSVWKLNSRLLFSSLCWWLRIEKQPVLVVIIWLASKSLSHQQADTREAQGAWVSAKRATQV